MKLHRDMLISLPLKQHLTLWTFQFLGFECPRLCFLGSVSEIKKVECFGQFDADAAMGDRHDNIIGLGTEKKERGLGGGGHGMLLNDVQIRQDEIMLGDL